jgi:hypothetical protein
MMPLSPYHLLHTQVGTRRQRYSTLSIEHTRIVQRLLVERAFRAVYSTTEAEWIVRLRPRRIDTKLFQSERDDWERWHAEQSEAEQSPSKGGVVDRRRQKDL